MEIAQSKIDSINRGFLLINILALCLRDAISEQEVRKINALAMKILNQLQSLIWNKEKE